MFDRASILIQQNQKTRGYKIKKLRSIFRSDVKKGKEAVNYFLPNFGIFPVFTRIKEIITETAIMIPSMIITV